MTKTLNIDDGLEACVEKILNHYLKAHESLLPSPGLYERILSEVEKPLLKLILQATEGNQKKAAEVLGINRNTLRKKMKIYNLTR